MSGFFAYQISPPLAYVVGICMFLNALLIAAKAYMQSHSKKYGFSSGGILTTIAMYCVAVWLMNRFLVLIHSKAVDMNLILLSMSMLAWRLSNMRDYINRSRKNFAVKTAVDGLMEKPAQLKNSFQGAAIQ